jgi:hypothetical protein
MWWFAGRYSGVKGTPGFLSFLHLFSLLLFFTFGDGWLLKGVVLPDGPTARGVVTS